MHFVSELDFYGCDPQSLLKSPEEVQKRLDAILADKILRFNPYTIDDETLLACVERGRWQPFPALTQMVMFHFKDIRRVNWRFAYDAMFLRPHSPKNVNSGVAEVLHIYSLTEGA